MKACTKFISPCWACSSCRHDSEAFSAEDWARRKGKLPTSCWPFHTSILLNTAATCIWGGGSLSKDEQARHVLCMSHLSVQQHSRRQTLHLAFKMYLFFPLLNNLGSSFTSANILTIAIMLLRIPLVLVAVSVALSLAYRYSNSRSANTTTGLSKITMAHAFAIEAIQLTLAIMGSVISCAMVLISPTILYRFQIADLELYISTWLAAVGILAMYASAVFTIDAIDSLIQLGSWTHPIQIQTLLLTRNLLIPSTVTTKHRSEELVDRKAMASAIPFQSRGRSRTPKELTPSSSKLCDRAVSEPATPTRRFRHIGVQFPSETRNALARTWSKPPTSTHRVIRTISTPSIVRRVRKISLDESPVSTRGVQSRSLLRASTPSPVKTPDHHHHDTAPALAISHTPSPIATKRSLSVHVSSTPSSIITVDLERTSASWENITSLDLTSPCSKNNDEGSASVNKSLHASAPPAFASSTVSSLSKNRTRARDVLGQHKLVASDQVGNSSSSVGGGLVKQAAKRFEQKG